MRVGTKDGSAVHLQQSALLVRVKREGCARVCAYFRSVRYNRAQMETASDGQSGCGFSGRLGGVPNTTGTGVVRFGRSETKVWHLRGYLEWAQGGEKFWRAETTRLENDFTRAT